MADQEDQAQNAPREITCSGGLMLPSLCVSFGDNQEGQDNG